MSDWRDAGESVAFVPTMGNLHRGHISLVEHARKVADHVVVSIFVNPTQFGEGEDFDKYPRTLEMDSLLLKRARCDLLFSPELSDVYPFGQGAAIQMRLPDLTDEFCGAFRPGHFDGVIGVVSRLFCMVGPDVAVFGQKDYQQLLVVRRMVSDLSMPVRIESASTIREPDGLALSSRNQYLTNEEREIAPNLHATLRRVAAELENGDQDFNALQDWAIAELNSAGFVAEYVGIRLANSLAPPIDLGNPLVVLAAARLGKARLIDNVLPAIGNDED